MRSLRWSIGSSCCMAARSSPRALPRPSSDHPLCVKFIWESPPMPEPLLEVRALDAHYGDFQALFGVSLAAFPGEIVAVIGANGAGKSTLLKCIAGAIKSRRDAIAFCGAPIGDLPAHAVVA